MRHVERLLRGDAAQLGPDAIKRDGLDRWIEHYPARLATALPTGRAGPPGAGHRPSRVSFKWSSTEAETRTLPPSEPDADGGSSVFSANDSTVSLRFGAIFNERLKQDQLDVRPCRTLAEHCARAGPTIG